MAGFLAVRGRIFFAKDYVGRNAKRGPMGPRSRNIMFLPLETDADLGEGSMEADVLAVGGIDAGIHGAEEIIATITKADPRIGKSHGEARESFQIRHDDGTPVAVTAMVNRDLITGIILLVESIGRRLVRNICLLAAEQKREIRAPIQCQLHAVLVAREGRRTFPGQRWS